MDIREMLAAIQKMFNDLEDKIKILSENLDAANQTIADHDAEIQNLKTNLNAANQTIADRDAEIQNLKTNLNAANQTIAECDAEIQDLKTNLDVANQTIAERDAKIQNLQTNLDAANQTIAERDAKIQNLQTNLNAANATITARDAAIQNLQQNLADANKKISGLESELADRNSRLANFLELESAFNLYKKLPENTKFALEGVFGAEKNPTSFLGGALQEGHLESLFGYAVTAIDNNVDPAETEILSKLIDFIFEAVNNGRREKTYAHLVTKIGDDFDIDTMQKSSASNQSGTVQNILLTGYKHISSGNVVKPSLVFLA